MRSCDKFTSPENAPDQQKTKDFAAQFRYPPSLTGFQGLRNN